MHAIIYLPAEGLNTLISGGELEVMYPMASSPQAPFGTAYLHLNPLQKPSTPLKDSTNSCMDYEAQSLSLSQQEWIGEITVLTRNPLSDS